MPYLLKALLVSENYIAISPAKLPILLRGQALGLRGASVPQILSALARQTLSLPHKSND
jgi:hypothetical protein